MFEPFVTILGLVYLLNLLPAFAPPTWLVLSYVAVVYHVPVVWLALVGAVAATLGRLTLARLSNIIIRKHLLTKSQQANVDVIRHELEHRATLTFSVFLFYAFSPFPSNQLFIAYGLTGLPLRIIGLAFFLGRIVSYLFWAFTASELARHNVYVRLSAGKFFSTYFIIGQLFALFTIYAFTKINWKALFGEKKIRWLKK